MPLLFRMQSLDVLPDCLLLSRILLTDLQIILTQQHREQLSALLLLISPVIHCLEPGKQPFLVGMTRKSLQIVDLRFNFNRFTERARLAEKTTVGSPIVDLDLVTPDGTRCQLADIVKSHAGKHLLIDFWASWCGICRASTPAIKTLYGTFDHAQFEVISVSCDEDDAAWRKAMQDDQMPWAQYCLTPDGYKAFFANYQTIGVPYYLLVNPEGKVIANPSGIDEVERLLNP